MYAKHYIPHVHCPKHRNGTTLKLSSHTFECIHTWFCTEPLGRNTSIRKSGLTFGIKYSSITCGNPTCLEQAVGAQWSCKKLSSSIYRGFVQLKASVWQSLTRTTKICVSNFSAHQERAPPPRAWWVRSQIFDAEWNQQGQALSSSSSSSSSYIVLFRKVTIGQPMNPSPSKP